MVGGKGLLPDSLNETFRRLERRGGSLAWGVARELTTVLESGRKQLMSTAGAATDQINRLTGRVLDTRDGALAYLGGGNWLESLYDALGIASTTTVASLDERIDEVEDRVDDVSRDRTREETMLLKQRLGELECLMTDLTGEEGQEALDLLIDRLGELEARIDTLPWPTIDLSEEGGY
ncbi:MAG: hypothetical protein ACE5D3_07110 [Candidatus Binatia bacterium]